MILVTGATGTVGSFVLQSLLEQGASVRAGVHVRPVELEGVETCPVDFDRPETLPPALESVKAVFLVSQDVAHERTLVEAAPHANVERIVKLSSFRADKDTFIVGQLHRQVECQIEDSGMKWTFLRPNYFMQNFVTLMAGDIRDESVFHDSIGDARVSRIDARDVARVATRVLTEPGHDGKAYDLSGPEAISHHDAARMFSEALGRTIRYVPIGDEEYRRRLLAGGMPEDYAEIFVDVNRQARTGKSADHIVTTAVEEITGEPPRSLADFCRDYAAVFTPA